MEKVSVSKRLGVAGCRVSVPMSQDEVLLLARADGNPHPESLFEWGEIVAAARPGDQLRLVDCLTKNRSGVATGNYYFALFRGGAIVAKMHHVIID